MEVEALRKDITTLKERSHRQEATVPEARIIGLADAHRKKKRCLDLFILLITAPLIIPLAIVTAVLIKLDSKGPVFFTQKRVGQLGHTFTMYKFRSMTTDSEKDGSKFARENDYRITRLGKFIRKFRIDEIPQFINVLKGDMSVIGPRPEQATFVELFNDEIHQYDLRHMVKPGITGLAQVQHGYVSSKRGTEMKLNYDLFYIRNYSIKLDLMIIWKTIKTILTGFGAR